MKNYTEFYVRKAVFVSDPERFFLIHIRPRQKVSDSTGDRILIRTEPDPQHSFWWPPAPFI
jgi:hypothetical protein